MMKGVLIGLLISFCSILHAQVYVQLELYNDPKALKYQVGDQITYQTYNDPGVWSKGRIEQILVDENRLILSNEILSLDQVTDFMLFRNSVKYLGGSVQTFGLIWLIQGTLAATFGKNTSWGSVLSIGGGSYLGGWLFRKLFYKVPVKLNEKNRLRIIDTRFIVPEKS